MTARRADRANLPAGGGTPQADCGSSLAPAGEDVADVCRRQAALIGVLGLGCWSGQIPAQSVRVKSAVQLVSQVRPPSGEKACSHRAVVAVMSDHL